MPLTVAHRASRASSHCCSVALRACSCQGGMAIMARSGIVLKCYRTLVAGRGMAVGRSVMRSR